MPHLWLPTPLRTGRLLHCRGVAGEVRYTQSDGLDIAYRVYGDGPIDVVVFPAMISHLELVEEIEYWRALIEQLERRARLIMFDRRGSGLSDRRRIGTAEERMDDLRAVMDAVESERAAIVGVADAAPMAVVFAATYPERITSLVLHGGSARPLDDPPTGYDVGLPQSWIDEVLAATPELWPAGQTIADVMGYPDAVEKLPTCARWARNIATPSQAVEILRAYFDTDVRHVLPLVSCPTLVIHNTNDPVLPVANGRYLADHIPGAVYTELPFVSNVGAGEDADVAAEHIVAFVTGAEPARITGRVLATVLFTDIVNSKASAVASGDGSWRRVLDRFESRAAEVVASHGGRVVKTTGDGVLALFDGPTRGVRAARALGVAASTQDIEIRTGVHTGEVELRGSDVGGIAVHLAARIQGQAAAGDVLVSRTVVDLAAGSGLRFEPRGRHELKGFDVAWELYAAGPLSARRRRSRAGRPRGASRRCRCPRHARAGRRAAARCAARAG